MGRGGGSMASCVRRMNEHVLHCASHDAQSRAHADDGVSGTGPVALL